MYTKVKVIKNNRVSIIEIEGLPLIRIDVIDINQKDDLVVDRKLVEIDTKGKISMRDMDLVKLVEEE